MVPVPLGCIFRMSAASQAQTPKAQLKGDEDRLTAVSRMARRLLRDD